ncbi:MAG: hypothetical protein HXY28_02465 [Hydrogenophilaceae bacterium]|nr:hypothetical protein [Hydrogenophilaceae bacterium]
MLLPSAMTLSTALIELDRSAALLDAVAALINLIVAVIAWRSSAQVAKTLNPLIEGARSARRRRAPQGRLRRDMSRLEAMSHLFERRRRAHARRRA